MSKKSNGHKSKPYQKSIKEGTPVTPPPARQTKPNGNGPIRFRRPTYRATGAVQAGKTSRRVGFGNSNYSPQNKKGLAA